MDADVPTYRRNFRTTLALEADNVPLDRGDAPSTASVAKAAAQNATLRAADEVDCSVDDPLLVPESPPPFVVPVDRYYFVKNVFLLLGVVLMLPWNFTANATDYWMYKFRNVSIPYDPSLAHKTSLQANAFSVFSVASTFPSLAAVYLGTLFNHKLKHETRNILGFCLCIAFFVMVTAFVKVDTDNWQIGFFVLTVYLLAFLNGHGRRVCLDHGDRVPPGPHGPVHLGPGLFPLRHRRLCGGPGLLHCHAVDGLLHSLHEEPRSKHPGHAKLRRAWGERISPGDPEEGVAAGGLCSVHPADLNGHLPGGRRPGGVHERGVGISVDRKAFHPRVRLPAVQCRGPLRKDCVFLRTVGREARATGARAFTRSHGVCAPTDAVQRPAPPSPARRVPLGRCLCGVHDRLLLYQRLPALRLPHAGLQESGELPPGEGRLPHDLCNDDGPLDRRLPVCRPRSDPLTLVRVYPSVFSRHPGPVFCSHDSFAPISIGAAPPPSALSGLKDCDSLWCLRRNCVLFFFVCYVSRKLCLKMYKAVLKCVLAFAIGFR